MFRSASGQAMNDSVAGTDMADTEQAQSTSHHLPVIETVLGLQSITWPFMISAGLYHVAFDL